MSFKLAPYAKAVEAALGAALVVTADFVNQFSSVLPAKYLAVVNTVIVVATAVRVFATKNAPLVDEVITAVDAAVATPAVAVAVPAAVPVPVPAPAPIGGAFQSPPDPSLPTPAAVPAALGV